MTTVLRTPEERFANLVDFPWTPQYVEVAEGDAKLRLARVDEGPEDAHPVVLLHGEPTWSFLWRHVIPPILAAGHRVIAPDQVGFGRSDKPERDWYSYERLFTSMRSHLDEVLPRRPVTLVVHDWGGPVGLRWAAENPDQVERIVVLNTGLYRSGGKMSDAWRQFHDFVQKAEELPIVTIIDGACLTDLTSAAKSAYEAPFPDASFHGGPLALPLLVPTSDDSPGAEEQMFAFARMEAWRDIPIHLLWGAKDPIIPVKVAETLAHLWPTARHVETVEAAHFLQEDAGEEIGRRIVGWIQRD